MTERDNPDEIELLRQSGVPWKMALAEWCESLEDRPSVETITDIPELDRAEYAQHITVDLNAPGEIRRTIQIYDRFGVKEKLGEKGINKIVAKAVIYHKFPHGDRVFVHAESDFHYLPQEDQKELIESFNFLKTEAERLRLP